MCHHLTGDRSNRDETFKRWMWYNVRVFKELGIDKYHSFQDFLAEFIR